MPTGRRRSLESIEKQIALLQAKADELKSRDKQGVIGRINEAILHYGLEAKDLVFGRTARRHPGSSSARTSSKRESKRTIVKYRDGDKTWVGRGKRPAWLNERLASGAKLEDFLAK
jgi:DNA-binding protein H-NS